MWLYSYVGCVEDHKYSQCTTTSTYYDLCLAHYIYHKFVKKHLYPIHKDTYTSFYSQQCIEKCWFYYSKCCSWPMAGQWLSIKLCKLHSSLYLPTYMCIHACIHSHAHTRTHARTHARTRARTHARTHAHLMVAFLISVELLQCLIQLRQNGCSQSA